MNRRRFLNDLWLGVGFLVAGAAGFLSLTLNKRPANAQQPDISGAASGAIHISGDKTIHISGSRK